MAAVLNRKLTADLKTVWWFRVQGMGFGFGLNLCVCVCVHFVCACVFVDIYTPYPALSPSRSLPRSLSRSLSRPLALSQGALVVAWSRILDAQPEFERAAVYKVAVSWSDSWGMYVYRRK